MLIGIFFWNNNIYSHHNLSTTPLIAWDKICCPKCEGGLGFRKTVDVNPSLLAKLVWKVLTDPNNIWVRVVPRKFLKNGNFLDVKNQQKHLSSVIWKYILDHRYLLKKGLCWPWGMVIRSIFGMKCGWMNRHL